MVATTAMMVKQVPAEGDKKHFALDVGDAPLSAADT